MCIINQSRWSVSIGGLNDMRTLAAKGRLTVKQNCVQIYI